MSLSLALPRFAELTLSPARTVLAAVAVLALAACGEAGPGAGGAGQADGFGKRVGAAAGEDDRIALRTKGEGRLAADATAGAGDQCNLAVSASSSVCAIDFCKSNSRKTGKLSSSTNGLMRLNSF